MLFQVEDFRVLIDADGEVIGPGATELDCTLGLECEVSVTESVRALTVTTQ